MQLTVELQKVEKSQKAVLSQLMEFYCYDFSEYLKTDVNEQGAFEYPYLDTYWTEPNRFAYFIKVAGNYAGFVLVNKHFKIITDPNGHVMAEFFIMRKYRRKGIGSQAARSTFDLHSGPWEVSQILRNKPAVKFWEKVIDEFTNGEYSVKYLDKDGMKKQVLIFKR